MAHALVETVNVIKGQLWNTESEFDKEKDKSRFRDYDSACERVKAFYREQHGELHQLMPLSPCTQQVLFFFFFCHAEKQTVEFNIKARVEFKSRRRARMGVWEAMELLNTIVDDSDPDVSQHKLPEETDE